MVPVRRIVLLGQEPDMAWRLNWAGGSVFDVGRGFGVSLIWVVGVSSGSGSVSSSEIRRKKRPLQR